MFALSVDVVFLDLVESGIFLFLMFLFTLDAKRKYRDVTCLAFVALMLGRTLLDDMGIIYGLNSTLTMELVMLACCSFLSKHPKSLILFLTNVACFLNVTCNILSMYLLNLFSEVSIPLMLQDPFYFDMTVFLAKVVFLLVGAFSASYLRHIVTLKLEKDWWYAGGIFLLLFIMFDQCYRVILTGSMQMKDLYIIFFSLIGLITLLIHLITSVHQLIQQKTFDETKRLELVGYKENFDFQDETMKKLRAIRHDFKYVKDYIEHSKEGDQEEILRYLERMEEKLDLQDGIICTGSPLYDMVLNERIDLCHKKHISLQLQLEALDTSMFDEYQLYQAIDELYVYVLHQVNTYQELQIRSFLLQGRYHIVFQYAMIQSEEQSKSTSSLIDQLSKVALLIKTYQGTFHYEDTTCSLYELVLPCLDGLELV